MEVHVFKNLCDKLKSMNLLVDDKKVSVGEGVGMFLLVVCHNTHHRLVAEGFNTPLELFIVGLRRFFEPYVTWGITSSVPGIQEPFNQKF